MSLVDDLNEYRDRIAAALPGLYVTRDPSKIANKVVLLIEAPDTVGEQMSGHALQMPVYLIGSGDGGLATNDALLEHLPAVLAALKAKTASYEVHASERPAYRILTTVNVAP